MRPACDPLSVQRFAKTFLAVVVTGIFVLGSAILIMDASDQSSPTPPAPRAAFARGFDASYVSRVEDKGGAYRTASGQAGDIFQILAENGVTYVRLRVWNDPAEGYCNQADVLALSQRARAAGLKILLDFHYSDGWADPGQQQKPASWSQMTAPQLRQAVYEYSYSVVSAMLAQGTPPDMVAIGNEITHGMLWPEGKVLMGDAVLDTDVQWEHFAALVVAGINGEKATGSTAQIMIHIASGDLDEMTWFFDNLAAREVDFDLVGLSYYPNWHGSLPRMRANLAGVAARYKKPVLIVETSYPFTLGWNDWTDNVIGQEAQLAEGYPATAEGQAAYLQAMIDMVKAVPGNQGQGLFYWGGEWIATGAQDESGSSWENQALFDFEGRPLPALVLGQP